MSHIVNRFIRPGAPRPPSAIGVVPMFSSHLDAARWLESLGVKPEDMDACIQEIQRRPADAPAEKPEHTEREAGLLDSILGEGGNGRKV